MPRFRLTVAYDGTAFRGWQRQDPPTGEVIRTVQATLESVIGRVVGEPVVVHGASRTDAGVHAKGQVACFDYRGQVPVSRLAAAINSRLPEDVLITDAAPAPHDFIPSSEATTKQYSYIWSHGGKHGVLRPLFDRNFVAFTAHALDPVPMHEAAQFLVGTHDFLAFTKLDHGRETTVRTIHRCDVESLDEHRLRIVVEGSGFLYNMVRIISGTLVEVGRGYRNVDWVREALLSLERDHSGPTAPAQGLCLEWLRYPDGRWHWAPESL